MFLLYYYALDTANRKLYDRHTQIVSELDSEKIYISVDDALSPTGSNPRRNLEYLKMYKVVPFGTVVLVSDVRRFMEKNGFPDYDGLYSNANVTVLFPSRSQWKEKLLEKYILQHYGITLLHERKTMECGVKAVKFISRHHAM